MAAADAASAGMVTGMVMAMEARAGMERMECQVSLLLKEALLKRTGRSVLAMVRAVTVRMVGMGPTGVVSADAMVRCARCR